MNTTPEPTSESMMQRRPSVHPERCCERCWSMCRSVSETTLGKRWIGARSGTVRWVDGISDPRITDETGMKGATPTSFSIGQTDWIWQASIPVLCKLSMFSLKDPPSLKGAISWVICSHGLPHQNAPKRTRTGGRPHSSGGGWHGGGGVADGRLDEGGASMAQRPSSE